MLETKTTYDSSIPGTLERAEQYHKSKNSISRYLAYRDLNDLFAKYVTGKEVLDYGAGTGISTEFLRQQGFNVTGVDINAKMLKLARRNRDINFYQIEPYSIFAKDKYDLIFSSFVLDEVPTLEKIILYFKAAKAALKKDGVFIMVTGNAEVTKEDFLTIEIDACSYPPCSGDIRKIYVPEFGIEFHDYYWTRADYNNALNKAGLELKEIHYPLGKPEDDIPWRDELYESPYIILVAAVKA